MLVFWKRFSEEMKFGIYLIFCIVVVSVVVENVLLLKILRMEFMV